MMTQLDFEAIAAVVADRTHANGCGTVAVIYPHELIADLCVVMKASNPRFKPERFISACQPTEP